MKVFLIDFVNHMRMTTTDLLLVPSSKQIISLRSTFNQILNSLWELILTVGEGFHRRAV